ncbi:MAG: hypothetical protein OJJ55_06560, partial [Rhodococcus sp.]|nr:hypothetical protein [Rhodococcus sp. (in: high G+C Gram-positive bacteria)]
MESYYDYGGDPATEARWDLWNNLPDLPMPGETPPFDKWLASKNLGRDDLVRIGTRWGSFGGSAALVYLFPDGLKYRTLAGKRSTEPGVTWRRSKIIPALSGEAEGVIIAEGETDGAYLSRIAPTFDVAILPAGALYD